MESKPESDDLPLSFRLPRAEWHALARIARDKGYSRSELCRLFIRRGMRYADDFPAKERTAADVLPPAVAAVV